MVSIGTPWEKRKYIESNLQHVKIYKEFKIHEQRNDAWQKLAESMDDTSIWKGHISVRKIGDNERESVLAFRKKKQIEIIEKNRNDLSVIIRYGKGPLGGYQIFQVKEDRILLLGDLRLKGIWSIFTKKGVEHVLEGELNALDRLFPGHKKD